MEDHQINLFHMENNRGKLYALISQLPDHPFLKEALLDESFRFESFTKTKVDLLDIHEIHLKNNVSMGVVVHGLKETIENVKKADIEEVATNFLAKDDIVITVYTTTTYSLLLGII